jgi:hypothetical protein
LDEGEGVMLCMSFKEGLKRRDENERKGMELGNCVWKNTHVLTFISNSSKLLIVFEINLTVNINGPLMNHLFDGSP